jgi:hypothetical protein
MDARMYRKHDVGQIIRYVFLTLVGKYIKKFKETSVSGSVERRVLRLTEH